MVKAIGHDVEVLPNMFSITFIDINHYMEVFKDCVDKEGKPIPIAEVLSVEEIKHRLDTVKSIQFIITDKDDSQLFPMVNYINNLAATAQIRYDLYGYNNQAYDNLMIAALLSNVLRCNNTKELITYLYRTSKRIIELQSKDEYVKDYAIEVLRAYKLPYVTLDLMKIFALNKVGTIIDKEGNKTYTPKGLKQVSINLKWYELLEYEMPPIGENDADIYRNLEVNGSYPYKGHSIEQLNSEIKTWDRYILDEYISPMLHYNKNDVFIVAEIVRLFTNEIKLRYSLSHSYKINLLNSSRSNISDKLFEKFYTEFSGIHPSQWKGKKTERTVMSFNKVIFPIVKFKTSELQEFLEDVRKVKVTRTNKDAFERNVKIGDLIYTVATGGLHTQDPPRALYSKIDNMDNSLTGGRTIANIDDLIDDDIVYVHVDVASYYPSIMSVYHVAPAHLNEAVFTKLITWLRDTRVKAKHSKADFIDGIPPKVLAEALKIVINSIYGKFGFEKGVLYDRLATLKVTINGQLMAIMLAEDLELAGIPVISANTDGLVVKLKGSLRETYKDILQKWMNYTGMGLDSEIYLVYVNRDINNYICQETNGKISYKGDFNPKMYLKDLKTGYDAPIVSKAVENYFLYNKPVMDTLNECTDILDFCKTQNIGKNYHVEVVKVVNGEIVHIPYQRYVRFYVSTDGDVIEKVHNTDSSIKSRLAAGERVTILNTLDDVDIANRHISYKYYYQEALKIIDPIKLGIVPKGKGKTRIRKLSGFYSNLFDE